ncbi:esterase/lipase family protein [Parasphingorhabdus pacifica]
MRAKTLLTTLFVLPSVWLPPSAGAATSSSFSQDSDPILFVHGYRSNGSTWDTMANRFQADGWPSSHLDQWSYDTTQSNATTAQQLAQEVESLKAATGNSEVDIVTHSMGGLSSRYYTKNLDGDGNVDGWVSLGGPNHGTTSANGCVDVSCEEMRIGSDFLDQLNSGDETPGSARYATWWSPCDEIIMPQDSTVLSGASNTETACLSHGALHEDATVYAQVRDLVDR